MRGYKANLAVVASRYGEFERRVLDLFSENRAVSAAIKLPGGRDIDLMYLLKDGLLAKVPAVVGVFIEGMPAMQTYVLTPEGKQFLAHWVSAEPVSAEADCLHEGTVQEAGPGWLACSACGMVQPTD